MTTAGLLLQFVACAVLIARTGFVLSRSADRLAQAYGWARGWVGVALLATVTSLPRARVGHQRGGARRCAQPRRTLRSTPRSACAASGPLP
jgi:hypothetical protein